MAESLSERVQASADQQRGADPAAPTQRVDQGRAARSRIPAPGSLWSRCLRHWLACMASQAGSILGEQTLRTRYGTTAEYAEQLTHLLSLMRLPFMSVAVTMLGPCWKQPDVRGREPDSGERMRVPVSAALMISAPPLLLYSGHVEIYGRD